MLYESIMHYTLHFYTHNKSQVTIYKMLSHTLHPLYLPYTHYMACDAPHHALSNTAPVHLKYTQHVTYHADIMQYKSVMHHTLHFPHTQHLAGIAPEHAPSHTAPPSSSIHKAYGK